MKLIYLTSVMVIILISLTSCTDKIVYIDPDYPTLQTWEVSKPKDIHFTVKTVDNNE